GDQVSLPSLNNSTGQTYADYLPGGTRGTSCAQTGGCTMSQVYPVPDELRTLLDSRASPNWTSGPFSGLSRCNLYTQLPAGTTGAGVLTNPNTGELYSIEINPDTGQAVNSCGPDAGWQLNWQPYWMPPRGTENTAQLFQVAF